MWSSLEKQAARQITRAAWCAKRSCQPDGRRARGRPPVFVDLERRRPVLRGGRGRSRAALVAPYRAGVPVKGRSKPSRRVEPWKDRSPRRGGSPSMWPPKRRAAQPRYRQRQYRVRFGGSLHTKMWPRAGGNSPASRRSSQVEERRRAVEHRQMGNIV